MNFLYKILCFFIVYLLSFGFPGAAFSLPQGEYVVSGNASFVTSGNNMVVRQTTDKAIIEYNSFSIGSLESVRFEQPGASSIALNRVTGSDPSNILGSLNSNGRIFLINPNGILFGSGAKVDTGGIVASTLDISNTDFLNDNWTFSGSGGSVINYGKINVNKPGGYAALLGAYVKNEGHIVANLASIALASGELMTLSLDAEGLIRVAIDQATGINPEDSQAAVENTGTLEAGAGRTIAGRIILTAEIVENVFDQAINTTGIIEATTLRTMNGQIALLANEDVSIGGTVTGGRVEIESNRGSVFHEEGSWVDAGGNTFRGYAGGDYIVAHDASIDSERDVDVFAGQDLVFGPGDGGGAGAVISGKNVFLTADKGSIRQESSGYAVQAESLSMSSSGGISGTGANGGLKISADRLAAHNISSGDVRIFADQDTAIADLSGLTGANNGVSGVQGISDTASDGEVDLLVNGSLDVYADIVGKGDILVETAEDLVQYTGADILVLLSGGSGLPQPVNLNSPSHDINVRSQDNTIDVTWQAQDPVSRETGHVSILSGGNYTMESGSKVQSNGGDIRVDARGDISLALADAGTGSVEMVSRQGSILDSDLGAAPADYDVVAHTIAMSAPNGSVGGEGQGKKSM